MRGEKPGPGLGRETQEARVLKNYEIKQAVLNMEQDYSILKQRQNANKGDNG